jgi:CBS domain-containing protein
MQVKDIMHRGVAIAAPETPIARLAAVMRDEDVGALPVLDHGEIIGMVTDRDITIRGLAEGRDIESLCARDVMSGDVACCREEEPTAEAVKLMETRRIRRMPVIDRAGELVGMLSLGDIAQSHRPDLMEEVVEAVAAHHA